MYRKMTTNWAVRKMSDADDSREIVQYQDVASYFERKRERQETPQKEKKISEVQPHGGKRLRNRRQWRHSWIVSPDKKVSKELHAVRTIDLSPEEDEEVIDVSSESGSYGLSEPDLNQSVISEDSDEELNSSHPADVSSDGCPVYSRNHLTLKSAEDLLLRLKEHRNVCSKIPLFYSGEISNYLLDLCKFLRSPAYQDLSVDSYGTWGSTASNEAFYYCGDMTDFERIGSKKKKPGIWDFQLVENVYFHPQTKGTESVLKKNIYTVRIPGVKGNTYIMPKSLALICYEWSGTPQEFRVPPHGNSKQGESFQRTRHSVLTSIGKKLQSQTPKHVFSSVLEEQGGYMFAESSADIPRNLRQVYSKAYNQGGTVRVSKSGRRKKTDFIIGTVLRRAQPVTSGHKPGRREGYPRTALAANTSVQHLIQPSVCFSASLYDLPTPEQLHELQKPKAFAKTSETPVFYNQNMFWIESGAPPLRSGGKKPACKHCNGMFARPGEPGFFPPADLYLTHIEQWYYKDGNGALKATEKAKTMYLHPCYKCVASRYPYFYPQGYLKISDTVRLSLKSEHKTVLLQQFGAQL